MAGIDDLQGSGVYDDGKGKGGESQGISAGPSDVAGSGSSGPSDVAGSGSSGLDVAGSGSSGPSDSTKGSEAQEVATQGFGWSFDPS